MYNTDLCHRCLMKKMLLPNLWWYGIKLYTIFVLKTWLVTGDVSCNFHARRCIVSASDTDLLYREMDLMMMPVSSELFSRKVLWPVFLLANKVIYFNWGVIDLCNRIIICIFLFVNELFWLHIVVFYSFDYC